MSREQGFWARRKAAVQAEEQAAAAAIEQQALDQEQAVLEDKTDAEVLAELELPDPDTLGLGDDFSAFMAKAVPDRIRRRALRKLWLSNPVLANVDMLVDYGEDFTDSAMAVENIQTAYQVGKGMLKHIEEMTRQAEARENPVEVEEMTEETQEEETLLVSAVDEDVAEAGAVETADVSAEAEEEAYIAPTPRRMKFRVEENTA